MVRKKIIKQERKRWNLPYPLGNVADSISWAQCHCPLLKALLASDVMGGRTISESSSRVMMPEESRIPEFQQGPSSSTQTWAGNRAGSAEASTAQEAPALGENQMLLLSSGEQGRFNL